MAIKSKKVIKILNILHVEQIGGPQIRVLLVAKQLRLHGIETIIVVPKGDTKFVEKVRSEGFKIYPILPHLGDPRTFLGIIRNIKYILTFPITIYHLLKIINREQVDIIHNNTIFNIAGFVAAIISRTKLVWHLTGTISPKIVRRIMFPFVVRYSDAIIAGSHHVAKHYSGNKHLKNLALIYTPVDINKFDPKKISDRSKIRLMEEFEINKNDIIIGSIGNISRVKGFEYLIEAVALVKDHMKKKGKNVKFFIVGEVFETHKKYYKELKKLIKRSNLDSEVIFTGFREDIPEILAIMDIFVLTSISEGGPRVLLEAMAMGKPIVATKVGIVPEVVDKKIGIIIPPKNSSAIASAIIKFSELIEKNPLNAHDPNHARKKIVDFFSLEKCVNAHVYIYKNIIKINPR